MQACVGVSEPQRKSSGVLPIANRTVELVEKGRCESMLVQQYRGVACPFLSCLSLQNLQERLRQTEQTPIVCMHCACASTTCTHYQQQHYATAKTGKLSLQP